MDRAATDPLVKIADDLVNEVFGSTWGDTEMARWVRDRARKLARRAFVDGVATGAASDE